MFFFIELIKKIVQVLPTYIHQGDIKKKKSTKRKENIIQERKGINKRVS